MRSPSGTKCNKQNFQILFKDSPEAFWIDNARMIIEGAFVRFIVFKGEEYSHDEFYPTEHVHRIKRFYCEPV